MKAIMDESFQEMRAEQRKVTDSLSSRLEDGLKGAMEAVGDIDTMFSKMINRVSGNTDSRVAELEGRLAAVEACLEREGSQLRQDLAASRSEHQAAFAEVEERIKAVGASTPPADACASSPEDSGKAQQDRREILLTLSAVCKDIETLQGLQKGDRADIEALLGRPDAASAVPEAPAAAALEELQTKLAGDLKSLESQLDSDLKALKESTSQSNADLEALKESTRQTTADLEALRGNHSAMATDLHGKLADSSEALEGCKRTVEELRNQQSGLIEATERYQALQGQQANVLETFEVEIKGVRESMSGEIQKLKSESSSHALEINSVSGKFSQMVEELRGNFASLEKALEECRTGDQLEALGGELKALRDDSHKEVVELADQVGVMESLQNMMIPKIEALQDQSIKLSADLELVQQRTARFEGKLGPIEEKTEYEELASGLQALQSEQSKKAEEVEEALQRAQKAHESLAEVVRGMGAEASSWRECNETNLDALRSQNGTLLETVQEQVKGSTELKGQVRRIACDVQGLLDQAAATSGQATELSDALQSQLRGEIQELQSKQSQQGADISELQSKQSKQDADISELQGQHRDTLKAVQALESTHSSFVEVCHRDMEEQRSSDKELGEKVKALQAQGLKVEAAQGQLTNDLAAERSQRSQDAAKSEAFQSNQGIEIATLKLQHTRLESAQTQLLDDLQELKSQGVGQSQGAPGELSEAKRSKIEADLFSLRSFCQDEIARVRSAQATAGEVMQSLQSKHSSFMEAMQNQYSRDIEELQNGQCKLIEAMQKRLTSDLGSLRTLRQGSSSGGTGEGPQSPMRRNSSPVKPHSSLAT